MNFDLKQYELIKMCSDMMDTSDWNKFREDNGRPIYLSKADLSWAELSGVNLSEAHLDNVNFNGAILRSAFFAYSELTGANLSKADLYKAVLLDTKLAGANLSGTNLDSTELGLTNLIGANLSNATLRNANLKFALLIKSDLSGADISGAHLYGTSRDNWKINGIKCNYVYWDVSGKERTPKNRDFRPGEFEALYNNLPEVTKYFSKVEGVVSMPKVFLSHSHADKQFVRSLANTLQEKDIFVWIDEAEIKIGESLTRKISAAIDEVDFVVAVISEASVQSEWVQKELDIAMNHEIAERRIKVLPVLKDDCFLPGFLQGKLFADFRKKHKRKQGKEKLVKTIREICIKTA